MFCNGCGNKLREGKKFCVRCGQFIIGNTASLSTTRVKFPLGKYFLVAFGLGAFSFITWPLVSDFSDNSYDCSLTEDCVTAFSEMAESIEPVGYFDKPELFDSNQDDEWFSQVKYLPATEPVFTEGNKTFASVVKIICENDYYIYYGSGTNIDPAGYILTNYHVVEDLPEDSCLVGFPDATGLIKEVYRTTIIYDKENETGYDLAYLAITDPFFDEAGNLYGYYSRIENGLFPYFEHTEKCLNTATGLGDELLILGYPPLSGGSLTITNGLVSSLYSQDGYIVTSAKIATGNSGGLAVDSNYCYIGVPTAFYYDPYLVSEEVFGEIIDSKFVSEFNFAIEDDFEEYYKENNISQILDTATEVYNDRQLEK